MLPRSMGTRMTLRYISLLCRYAAGLLATALTLIPNLSCTAGLEPGMLDPKQFNPSSQRRSFVDCQTGYLFDTNRLFFRDGDNPNIRAGVQDVYMQSPLLTLRGQKFFEDDIGVRVTASVSLPQSSRNNVYLFDGDTSNSRLWETRHQTLDGDLTLVYDFALGNMPYDGGLLAGIRYNYFEYASDGEDKSGPFLDSIHTLVPNLGFYYTNSDFAGFRVRFEGSASPFVFSRVYGDGFVGNSTLRVDGMSIFGAWYDTSLSVSAPVTDGIGLGLFCRYNYIEITGGATLTSTRYRDSVYSSTRFSMDSKNHLFVTGVSASYAFLTCLTAPGL